MTDTCSLVVLLSPSLFLSQRSCRRRFISSRCTRIPCGGRPDGRSRSLVGSTALDRAGAATNVPSSDRLCPYCAWGPTRAVVRVRSLTPRDRGREMRESSYPGCDSLSCFPTADNRSGMGHILYLVVGARRRS